MSKIIQANNLTKIYGEKETSVTALDNINIEFRENEFTARQWRSVDFPDPDGPIIAVNFFIKFVIQTVD